MSGILKLENLNRGTTLKQGDKTVLSYRLSDADGDNLNIAGNTAVARLMHPDFTRIGYESEALTVSEDNIVQFSIDSIIPSRLYYLEITVDGQYIFPSRSDEGKLSIDRSSMGAEITIIENAGIDTVVRKAVDLINEDPSLIIDEDKLISEIIANTTVGSIEEYYQEYRDAIKEYADLKPKALNAISKSDDAITLSESVQEQLNQVVIEGDSSVEASQARVNADGVAKATLKQRLDDEHNEVTAQLAQKVGLGKKAELEDLSADVLSAIEGGEGTEFNLLSIPQDKSVSPLKTTFAKGGGGVNLFDGTYTHLFPSGNPPYTVSDSPGRTSAIIPLKPDTDYIFWKTKDSERFRIAIFDHEPEVGSIPTSYAHRDVENEFKYTTNSDEIFALVQLSSEGRIPSKFQVEKGAVKSSYYSPNEKIMIDLHESSFADIMQRSEKNLFDGNYYTGHLSGITPHSLVTSLGGIYALTPVEPNTTYTISKSNKSDRFRFGVFDEYPVHGSIPTLYETPDNTRHTITTDDTAKYLVTVPVRSDSPSPPEQLQIERGNVATAYEEPVTLKSSLIPRGTRSEHQTPRENVFLISGNLKADYNVITETFPMDSSLDLNTVYDWFDDLVSRHPDRWSRSLLTTETSGLPVYRYDYKPPVVAGGADTQFPKILHVNGIHGSEKQSLGSGMRFYKDLSDHWKENILLQTFASNVHFIVIPAFNAWGVENDRRGNANGVDLNRDFPDDWRYISDSYGLSSGDEPISQPESQALMNLLETESNIVFAIDHHRYNPYAQEKNTIWTGTKNNIVNNHLVSWSRDAQFDFIKMHPELTDGEENFVRVLKDYMNSQSGWLGNTFPRMGIAGTIFEISLDTSLNDYHTKAMAKLFAHALEEFAVKGKVVI